MAVMGLKTGVKSWSESPQNEITKPESTQTISANEKGRFKEEDLAATLNKIADPNWVDPSRKARAVGNDKLDKDAFMKMMLAQMKNQDPTNPLKSHEMAAQLAQFSTVEQMTNINQTLTDMRAAQKPQEGFQALTFIGKAVAGDSANLVRVKGDKSHDFTFNLMEDANEISVRIRNPEGEVIRNVDLRDLKKGENRWEWNGQDERGNAVPAGEYKFLVEAKTNAGKKVGVQTDFSGTISGVNYTPEGPVLLIGTQSVRLKDVKKIVDPMYAKSHETANKIQDQQATSGTAAGDKQTPPGAQIMNNVGLDSGMMAKIQKETAGETNSR